VTESLSDGGAAFPAGAISALADDTAVAGRTIGSMECAAWTYELAPTGAASAGLEDYEIRAADGEHLGIGLGVVSRAVVRDRT
jgi:hypothetical protein